MSEEFECKLTGGGSLKPITLDVSTTINAFVAETRVTVSFFNPSSEDKEGELVLPLDESSTVCGLAVDINGDMVDAVVVEKESARAAFESEVREKVTGRSTTIAEHVAGNAFKTRLYPLPKNSSRTVRVSISSELAPRSDKKSWIYTLPITPPKSPTQSLSFSVSVQLDNSLKSSSVVSSSIVAPVLSDDIQEVFGKKSFGPGDDDGQFVFKAQQQQNQQKTSSPSCRPRVSVIVPALESSSGSGPRCVAHEGSSSLSFFSISEYVQPSPSSSSSPEMIIDESESQRKLMRIGIIWDSSKSFGKVSEKERCINIIESMCLSLGDKLGELCLFTLNTCLKYLGAYKNHADEVVKMIRSIESTGATNMSALKDLPQQGIDCYLMFSDGMNTWGDREDFVPKQFGVPIHTICCGDPADFTLMKRISSSTTGTFFNLSKTSENQAIIDGIIKPSLMFIRCEYNQNQITEVYPAQPVVITPSAPFRLAGQLPNHNSDVTLNVLFGTSPTHITQRMKFVFSPTRGSNNASTSSLLARFWAQKKLDHLQLMPEGEEKKKLVLNLGREYGIVTSETSFIIMDTLEQFLKYNIEPPAALAEIRRQYLLQIKEKQEADQKKVVTKFARVQRAWKRRVQWWEMTFDDEKPLPLFRHFMDPENLDRDQDDAWGQPGITLKPKEKESLMPMELIQPSAIESRNDVLQPAENMEMSSEEMVSVKKLFVEVCGSETEQMDIGQVRESLNHVLGWNVDPDAFDQLSQETGVRYSGFCGPDVFLMMLHRLNGANTEEQNEVAAKLQKHIAHHHRKWKTVKKNLLGDFPIEGSEHDQRIQEIAQMESPAGQVQAILQEVGPIDFLPSGGENAEAIQSRLNQLQRDDQTGLLNQIRAGHSLHKVSSEDKSAAILLPPAAQQKDLMGALRGMIDARRQRLSAAPSTATTTDSPRKE